MSSILFGFQSGSLRTLTQQTMIGILSRELLEELKELQVDPNGFGEIFTSNVSVGGATVWEGLQYGRGYSVFQSKAIQ